MNKLDVLKSIFTRNGSRALLVGKKFSPEILTAVGVVGVVAATVLACKATLELPVHVEDFENKVNDVHELRDLSVNGNEVDYPKREFQKDLAKVYFDTAVGLTRLYGPPVILGVASIGCILGSHKILKDRNAGLVVAYKLADEGLKKYRSRVVEAYGEEVDKSLIAGIHERKEIVVQDNGKKSEEQVLGFDPNSYSRYARFFDESSSQWDKHTGYNLQYLRGQQNYFNDILKVRGHVFLNEVYDALGIPRSPDGALVGWVYGKNGDDYIDFGIYDLDNLKARDFVNGYERSILLDFNVDGIIYDLI